MDITKLSKKHEEKKKDEKDEKDGKEKGKEVARGFFSKHKKEEDKGEKDDKEKQEKCAALSPHAKAVGAGIAAGAAAHAIGGTIHGALANTKAGKETHKAKAEALGHVAANAKDTRKKHPGHYALNPHAAGPLSEAASRIGRRHHAAAAEHPYKSHLIPLYSVIKGGKAGAEKK